MTKQIVDGARVLFMPIGQKERDNSLLIGLKEVCIRQEKINSWQVLGRISGSGIDKDDLASVCENPEHLTKLALTTQGNYSEAVIHYVG